MKMKKSLILIAVFMFLIQAGITLTWGKPSDKPVPVTLQNEDVGVTAIVSPPEPIVQGVTYQLKSEVTNFATESSSFDVIFDIYIAGSSTLIISDTTSVVLMAGGTSKIVTFGQTFIPALDTSYQLISYTILAGDINPANNTSTITTYIFDQLAVWYGNVDGSKLNVNINNRVSIDAYVYSGPDVYVENMLLCLGADSVYIDSLLSRTEGSMYYPLTEWGLKEFLLPQGSPPNPAGWSSQGFLGVSRFISPTAPLLHYETPTRILTYVVKTANNSSLIGQTANAIGIGADAVQGGSNAGDSLGIFYFTVFEHFSPFYFLGAGHISGIVIDDLSQPIENVVVIDLTSSKATMTDDLGHYTLSDLPPGSHDISFSHPGYTDTTITGINVLSNTTTTLNVQMPALPFDDVGVSDIISPPQFIQMNMTYPVISEVTNYGTATSTFSVIFETYILGSSTPEIIDTITVTDMPGSSIDTVTFSSTLYTSLDTVYEHISYTILEDDVNGTNDSSSQTSSIFFGISAWYGNLDDTPLSGFIDDRLEVDVYVQTVENIYLSYIHLCLGAADQHIDSLLSQDEGQFYYPFTQWDIALFSSSFGSPPNPAGWISQSFLGLNSLGSMPNPWLHLETPAKILTFMVKTVNNPLLIGDTVDCFGAGINSSLSISSASDTLLANNYPIIETFSPVFFKAVGFVQGTVTDEMFFPIKDVLVTAVNSNVNDSTDGTGYYFLDDIDVGTYDILFSHPVFRDTVVEDIEVLIRQIITLDMVMQFPCDYVPGDMNGNGYVQGGDLTYGVNYMRSAGPPPPDSCFNSNAGSWLYSAADCNGDCAFQGADITFLVEFFRRNIPSILFCPYTPPIDPPDFRNNSNMLPIIIPQEIISMEDEK